MEETELKQEELSPEVLNEFVTWLSKRKVKEEHSRPAQKTCEGCNFDKGDHCSIWSAECVNSKSKPYYVTIYEMEKLLRRVKVEEIEAPKEELVAEVQE